VSLSRASVAAGDRPSLLTPPSPAATAIAWLRAEASECLIRLLPETAWKGGTVKGGACAIASATRPEGAPLTGLPWRATQSEADEAPGIRPGVSGLVVIGRSRRYAAVGTDQPVGNRLFAAGAGPACDGGPPRQSRR
jgi:hypothetical protein